MKYIILVTSFCLAISTIGISQELHLPDEIAEIMQSSIKYYDLKHTPNIAKDKTLDVLPNDFYFQKDKDDGEILNQYRMEEDGKFYKKFQKAEVYISKKKYSKARKLLTKLLKKNPEHAIILTKIGWTHYYENNYIEAIKTAKKAIRFNFVHYPAYILLTNIHLRSNQLDEAMEAITKAHLLNRNSPDIILMMKKVFKQKKLIYENDWTFIKQYKLSIYDNKVLIEYANEPWKAYAACQALWKYEPYYEEKMKISSDDIEKLREHECLLNMLVAYENWEKEKPKKQFTMGLSIKKAIKEKMIAEFILYEIKLTENPKLAFYFTQDDINNLAKYILTVRSHKEPENKQIVKEH